MGKVKKTGDQPQAEPLNDEAMEAQRKKMLEEAAKTADSGKKREGKLPTFTEGPRADEQLGQMGATSTPTRMQAFDTADARTKFRSAYEQAISSRISSFPPIYAQGMAGGGIVITGDSGTGKLAITLTGTPKDPARAEMIRKQIEAAISGMSCPQIQDPSTKQAVNTSLELFEHSWY